MILSLSGKANSGKDLVANIIQYLIIKSKYPDVSFETFELYDTTDKELSGFVIKKWADKLKDIVCLLAGCTGEQLENRYFKESELGPEWWQYKTDAYNYDGSEFCEEKIFKSEVEALEYVKTNPRKYEYIEYIGVFKPTYRYLLQHIGTDLLRDQLHPQIWVNALMSNYRREGGYEGGEKTASDGGYYSAPSYKGEYPSWIISDTRFPNELQAVKDKGGLTIMVKRPNMFDAAIKSLNMEHISETALDSAEFDEVIINDGSIEELIKKVKVILIKYKII